MSRKDRAVSNKLLIAFVICLVINILLYALSFKSVFDALTVAASLANSESSYNSMDWDSDTSFDFSEDTSFDFSEDTSDSALEYETFTNESESASTGEPYELPSDDFVDFNEESANPVGYIDPANIDQSVIDNYNLSQWQAMTGIDVIDIETANAELITDNQVNAVINQIANSEFYSSCTVDSCTDEDFGTGETVIRRYTVTFDDSDKYYIDYAVSFNLTYGYKALA